MSGLFTGDERRQREHEMRDAGRLPPGQSLTLKWPVLHYGSVPAFDAAKWDLRVGGAVPHPLRLTWEDFNHLPRTEVTRDFHCVTRWSRFDNRWSGVPFRELLKLAFPDRTSADHAPGSHVLVHGEQGYAANLPVADLDRDDVLLATHHDGAPLTPDHGYPVRLIVPHLYAWKSVKWVRGFEFFDHDVAGFWEQNGYHIYGDPWREQRFDSDE